jgi:hypothetical protein
MLTDEMGVKTAPGVGAEVGALYYLARRDSPISTVDMYDYGSGTYWAAP